MRTLGPALVLCALLPGCGGGGGPIDPAGDAAVPPDLGHADLSAADAPPADDLGSTSPMTFFVSSRGLGRGGDLRRSPAETDGLAGADALCLALAAAISPSLGGRTWRAYLSTSTVNARDRIGPGPWSNAHGVLIAHTVAELHEENGGMNALGRDTALDEHGAPLYGIDHPDGAQNEHDILTGSDPSGRTMPDDHCADWTSSSPDARGRVGHSDRMGGPTDSWNSVHDTKGCAESGPDSVRAAGGRGSIYCFAAD